jgi:WXG100 family type VII secretion target
VSDSSKKRVDPAILTQIAGKFESTGQEIDSQLRAVQNIVDETRQAWGGKAGLGFQSAAQMWGKQQANVIRLLQETAQLVRDYARVSVGATDQAEQAVVASGNAYDLPELGGAR